MSDLKKIVLFLLIALGIISCEKKELSTENHETQAESNPVPVAFAEFMDYSKCDKLSFDTWIKTSHSRSYFQKHVRNNEDISSFISISGYFIPSVADSVAFSRDSVNIYFEYQDRSMQQASAVNNCDNNYNFVTTGFKEKSEYWRQIDLVSLIQFQDTVMQLLVTSPVYVYRKSADYFKYRYTDTLTFALKMSKIAKPEN